MCVTTDVYHFGSCHHLLFKTEVKKECEHKLKGEPGCVETRDHVSLETSILCDPCKKLEEELKKKAAEGNY